MFNTLTKKKEEFKSIKPKKVGLYTCGPTVYDYDHIGHAWNYFNADILRRVLEYNGYRVKHVMNITDVGHLVADADSGEDKMEKSAQEKGKTAREIAGFFTDIYLKNRLLLNLEKPKVICKATDHIKEMVKLVQKLLDKGYAYEASDGIYFDTAKFPQYGQLSGNTLAQLKEGARVEINPEKRNPTDFALWKFTPAGQKRQMEWKAFNKMGFPGWHIECSAMSNKYLGQPFDLHTGGEDNIFPHHECEIAQSEAAEGKKFVNFWFHPRFLQVEGEKMSKSKKNFYTLQDLIARGFEPLDLRYLFLTAHYNAKLNFTWQGLAAAQAARARLNDFMSAGDIAKTGSTAYEKDFTVAINNDLDLPKALAIVWNLIKDQSLPDAAKRKTILKFDKVFGLSLDKIKAPKIPGEIKKLAEARNQARNGKDWVLADKLRQEIEAKGYLVNDNPDGFIIKVKSK